MNSKNLLFGLILLSTTAVAQQPPTLPYVVTGSTSTGLPITKPVGSGTTSATPMPVTLSSGGSTIGTVDIDQTTPGTTNGVVVNSSALPTGASTAINQTNVQSAPGTPQTTALTVQGNASGVPLPVTTTPPTNATTNVTQFNGVNVSTGTGVGGAGIPRVTVSSDSFPATQAISINHTTPGTTDAVTLYPTSSVTAAIAPIISSAAESNHVLKASPGNLYDVYVTTTSASGYLLLVNAISAPAASGAAIAPIHCIPVAANSYASVSFNGEPPESYSTGIVAVFSTTGCFTNTASSTAFFHGRVQ